MKNFKRLLSSALVIAMVLSTFILIPAAHTHVFAAEGDEAVLYQLNGTAQDSPFEIFYANSVTKIYGGEEQMENMEKFDAITSEWATTAGGENFIKTSGSNLVARVWSKNGGGNGGDAQNVGIRFTAPATGRYVFDMRIAGEYVKIGRAADGAPSTQTKAVTYSVTLTKGTSIWFYVIGTQPEGTSATAKEATFSLTADFYCGTVYSIGRPENVAKLTDEVDPFRLLQGGAYAHGTVLETAKNATVAEVGTSKASLFYTTEANELVVATDDSRTAFIEFTAPEAGTYAYVYYANMWENNVTTASRNGAICEAASGLTVGGASYFLSFEGDMVSSETTHPFKKDSLAEPIKTVELEQGEKIYFWVSSSGGSAQSTVWADVIKIGHSETGYETTDTVHTAVCSACKTVQGETENHNTDGENGACSVCGYTQSVVEPEEPTECTHEYTEGVCGLCGDVCTHVGTWTEEGCSKCGVTEHTCVAAGAPVQGENSCTDTCTICGTEMVASHEGIVKCEQCGSEFSAYLAGLVGDTDKINIGDSFAVALNMGGVKTTYNSFKLVFTYDTTYLTFDQGASTLAKTIDVENKTMELTVDNGTITITGYGADIVANNSFKLVFDAIEATGVDTDTLVTLTYAAFSDKVMAEVEDLEPLTQDEIDSATAGVEINGTYTVTVEGDNVTADADTVEHGEDVTFRVDDVHYDYDVTVTVKGEKVTPDYDEATGVFTVTDVTGDVEFTVNGRTAHTYNVTTTYDELAEEQRGETPDPDTTATHDTNFVFYIPADIEAVVEQDKVGYNFSVAVKINGVTYSVTPTDEGMVTIPGADIVGDIAIEVTASVIQTTEVVVEVVAPNFEGTKVDPTTPSAKGEDVTLVITPDDRFDYVVTATVSGTGAVEVTKVVNEDGTVSYTVAGTSVTGKVTFNVTTTLHVAEDNVAVNEYLTLDGTKMWLVKVTYAGENAGVYTINGANMFFSEEYDAFCYLVIDDELTVGEAIAMVGLNKEGTATNVVYTGDVNMTGRVDLNDAQLTWNMYNEQYAEFTTRVTMEKFLRADVNASGAVDTADSVAIVAAIAATPQA